MSNTEHKEIHTAISTWIGFVYHGKVEKQKTGVLFQAINELI
ncbi:hypothetical protein [Polaribacter atrinae]